MTDWKNCNWNNCPILISNLRVEKDLTDDSDDDSTDNFSCFNIGVSIANRSSSDLSYFCKNVYCEIEGDHVRRNSWINRSLLFKEELIRVPAGMSIKGSGIEYLSEDENFEKIFVEVYVQETGNTYRETFLVLGSDNYIPWKIEKAHCD